MSRQVVPSQMNYQIYTQKGKAARRGYDLLKKKNDSLKKRMQDLLILLIERKKQLRELFADAFFSIAECEWAAGDFFSQIRDQVNKASFTLDIHTENIAGVQLPMFIAKDANSPLEKLGRTKGGVQIEKSRNIFKKVLETIVDIASLQTSFIRLDQVIQVTSRRVNALEYIVVPNIDNVLIYIQQEMDEEAREEKYTLKKVLENRKIAAIEMEKMNNIKKEQQENQNLEEADLNQKQSDNILHDSEEEDILF